MFFTTKHITDFETKTIKEPDEECLKLLKSNAGQTLFNRGKKSFKWIFSNPWISTVDKRFIDNYPFSSFSKAFRYETLKIYTENKFEGFILYSIRDKHLKALYSTLNGELLKTAAQHLSNLAAKERIEIMTILDPILAEAVSSSKNPFIKTMNIEHRIYSSFKLERGNKKIQAGDGDFVFS